MSLHILQRARAADGGVAGSSHVCGVNVREIQYWCYKVSGLCGGKVLTGRPPI